MIASPARSQLDPVLLLHGQPGGARGWDRVVAALGDRAPVVRFDRPGWDRCSSASDLPGNARFALTALDMADVERAIVVGHSFGGAVAAWLAASFPERVSALVLAAPSANLASMYALDRVLAAPVVGEMLGAASLAGPALAFALAPARRRIAARLALDEDYLRAAGRALRGPRAWRSFVTEQRALIEGLPLLETHLARIGAPTTILIGRRDWVVPPASARRLATQIEGASLELLEHAGHLLPLRHPARLAQAIIDAGTLATGESPPGRIAQANRLPGD